MPAPKGNKNNPRGPFTYSEIGKESKSKMPSSVRIKPSVKEKILAKYNSVQAYLDHCIARDGLD